MVRGLYVGTSTPVVPFVCTTDVVVTLPFQASPNTSSCAVPYPNAGNTCGAVIAHTSANGVDPATLTVDLIAVCNFTLTRNVTCVGNNYCVGAWPWWTQTPACYHRRWPQFAVM